MAYCCPAHLGDPSSIGQHPPQRSAPSITQSGTRQGTAMCMLLGPGHHRVAGAIRFSSRYTMLKPWQYS